MPNLDFFARYSFEVAPQWLTFDVRKELINAIESGQSEMIRDLLMLHSPDPKMRHAFGVFTIVASEMILKMADELGNFLKVDDRLEEGLPISLLNAEFVDGGLRVTIGDELYFQKW